MDDSERIKLATALTEMINAALDAAEVSEEARREESMARSRATDAMNREIRAWNEIYTMLLQIAQEQKNSQAFQGSDLGRLLLK